MKGLRIHLRHRRLIAGVVTLVAIAICGAATQYESSRLGSAAIMTGSVVLAGLFILLALGVRRRLPFWPLGSASTWTQVHLYVGIFTTAVYAMHVPVLVVDGPFEMFLSMLFLAVATSGFYGIYASRSIPRKITAVEGQHRFDRVAFHRVQIANTATKIITDTTESSAAIVLKTFYQHTLEPFFVSKPSLAYVIAPIGNRRRRLLGGLKELDRYLEGDGRRAAGQFAALVRRRDDLDYQYALQLRLRCWVVFHSFLSVLLVGASLVHVALVLRFIG